MISFKSAFDKVLENTGDYGTESVNLLESNGRILAEQILADRDFPPFDRATKDGIAIKFRGVQTKKQSFKSEGIAQAGSPQLELKDHSACIEVMTGAMVPINTDTVVMYENTVQENGNFTIAESIKRGQNIHYRASDISEKSELLQIGTKIGAAEIGVLATVGKSQVKVKKLPKIAVVATGNELVEVNEIPLPYQIRKSNTYSLVALLRDKNIHADSFHLVDDKLILKERLKKLLANYDVLLLSGGVSKGKYDFLPAAFDELGVKKIFHKVLQRPGKPFWFGKDEARKAIVFSFPGNPVSTFVNYHVHFIPWLNKSLGTGSSQFTVFLEHPIANNTGLTVFMGVNTRTKEGTLCANMLKTSGSGDILSLSRSDGFVKLEPNQVINGDGAELPFIRTKNFDV